MRSRRGRGWEFYPEFGADTVGFHADLSAHSLHGFSNDGQANSRAWVHAVRVNALEKAKKAGAVLGFNADAVLSSTLGS